MSENNQNSKKIPSHSEVFSDTSLGKSPTHVVIVGGGFAGLNAAKELAQHTDHNGSVQITLVDRHNYHLFQPLLYQVAMAGLNPGEIAVPIRSILGDYQHTRVLMAEVTDVDLKNRLIKTDAGQINYDYLIMACGAQHSYFGREDWERFAPGLKTLEQATEVRRRVLSAFELAERETDPEKIEQLLTFIVVGGGPTGVELAGSLGEISRYTLSTDFRHIDPKKTKIILIEAGERILASFDPKLSKRAVQDLNKLGVTVRTGARVTNITDDGVALGDECLKASTVLWAAGVMPSKLSEKLGTPLDRVGRVIIEQDLSLKNHSNVFVLGDQAHLEVDGKPLPGLAPVAMQQGRAAAKAILHDLHKKPRENFRYVNKGQMATIGRRKAVAESGPFKFGGALAWYAWLIVHVFYLVGFKSRVQVMLQWFWSYMTYKRGAQLITARDWRSFGSQEPEIKANEEKTDEPHTDGDSVQVIHQRGRVFAPPPPPIH